MAQKRKTSAKKAANKAPGDSVKTLPANNADMPQDPKFVTKSFVSRMLGKSERTINAYQGRTDDALPIAASNTGPKGLSNGYDPREVFQWAVRNTISEMMGDLPNAEGYINTEFEKGRLLRAQATAAEIKNAKESGELIMKSDVVAAFSPLVASIKSILDSIPLRVKSAAPHLGVTELNIIRREISRASEAIARIRLYGSSTPTTDDGDQ